MIEELLTTQGKFALQRLPKESHESLRAWDAADEYVLQHIETLNLPKTTHVLILNDSFGALACALHLFQPYALSDSYLSQQATRLNLAENKLPESSVTLLKSVDVLPHVFDLVIIKVPKTLALFEFQLLQLRSHINENTQIIALGMIKILTPSVWQMLERIIGKTQTSLAQKKARLIFATLDSDLSPPQNPYPIRYILENTDYEISNHANVFSREKLDIGTRFFLEHLPKSDKYRDIIDLGCGNGIVGLMAAQKNPTATIHFVDESFMAIESARENFEKAFKNRIAHFHVGNCLTDFAENSADLVLCNPPFHQQHVIGDFIAQTMFKQAKNLLRQHGELLVIGNRHLNYGVSLSRIFGKTNVKLLAQNNKFQIWQARLLRE
ncbi:MAG: methyltransferase [Methylococcales bacterium]|nr:methyltransferase [Methylococcales bacterium]